MNRQDLSRRQQQCWAARQAHFSAKEIGQQLGISPHTVAMHWRLARLKLGSQVPVEPDGGTPAQDVPGTAGRAGEDWLATLVLLVLGMGAVSFLLTLIGIVILRLSPWFAHLRH